MTHRATCSCGRTEVELGCDLCAYCRREHEERHMAEEHDAGLPFIGPADYEARWIPAGPDGEGGWDCHTFPGGATMPALCQWTRCPGKK